MVPAGVELRAVPSAKSTRVVADDHTVRFEGLVYQSPPPPRCPSLARSEVEVRRWFDGGIHFAHGRHGAIPAKRLRRRGKGS